MKYNFDYHLYHRKRKLKKENKDFNKRQEKKE
jgi:hypothetical protein